MLNVLIFEDVAKPSIGEQMDFCLKVFHEVAKELKEASFTLSILVCVMLIIF